LPERRFRPPWSVEESDACFIVRDANGQALAYRFLRGGGGDRAAASSAYVSQLVLLYYRRQRVGGKYGCRIGRGERRGRFWVLDMASAASVSAQQIGNSQAQPSNAPRPRGPGNKRAPIQPHSLLRAAVLSPGIRTTSSSP
jgi:hypothetical protein